MLADDGSPCPEVLYIKKVMVGGLLNEYNVASPDSEVRVGDRVIEVNGKTTIEEMSSEFKVDAVKMRIVRYPDVFHVVLQKRQGIKLGFKFKAESALPGLKISEVSEGLLSEANTPAFENGDFHRVVLAGMRIEAANNAEGEAANIADEIRKATSMRLRIRRQEAVVPKRLEPASE